MCSTREGNEKHIQNIALKNSGRKREIGRLRCKWEDTMKMSLNVIRSEVALCTELTQDKVHGRALASVIMTPHVP
jgi:hypothetical protein